MKTFITIISLCFLSCTICTTSSKAQCTSPGLVFANPTLVNGTALSEGAVYKFPNVIPGVDCHIKLKKFNGGATLIAMETPGQGYSEAWQPIIKGPGTPFGNKSWIDWEVAFKTPSGNNYSFTCLDISAIDVDGDNASIGEFIESDGHVAYHVPTPTLLTITDMGSGRLEAQAPIINRPSIDTSAMDVRIGFTYNGKDKIELKLGSTVLTTSAGATERLNCIYFKRMVLSNYVVLPVRYVSLAASANQKNIDLNWVTDNEVNNSHFEAERSYDGINFTRIATVLDALTVDGANKHYLICDKDAVTSGKVIVYYRLKQVDTKGSFSYSNTVAVKLVNKINQLQLLPNPFVESVSLQFNASANGAGVIRLQNLTGQRVADRQVSINKGSNTVKMDRLTNLSNGMYIAQVVIDGVVVYNQKIMKN